MLRVSLCCFVLAMFSPFSSNDIFSYERGVDGHQLSWFDLCNGPRIEAAAKPESEDEEQVAAGAGAGAGAGAEEGVGAEAGAGLKRKLVGGAARAGVKRKRKLVGSVSRALSS